MIKYIKYLSVLVLVLALTGVYFVNKLAKPYMPKRTAFRPSGYRTSRYSNQKVFVSRGKYNYRYTFTDHRGVRRTWVWKLGKNLVDKMILKFGIDKNIFRRRRFRARNRYELRKKIQRYRRLQNMRIKRGFFMRMGSRLIVADYNNMVNYYMKLTLPVYRYFNALSKKYNLSYRKRIELLLRFCQDIPYGIPPKFDTRGKFIGGILTPPQIFNLRWGDCDSKSVLFAAIMAHNPRFRNGIINMVSVPGHMFVGLKIRKNPYDTVINYRGRRLVVCEPVGVGRLPVGKAGRHFRSVRFVVPIRISGAREFKERNAPSSSRDNFNNNDNGDNGGLGGGREKKSGKDGLDSLFN